MDQIEKVAIIDSSAGQRNELARLLFRGGYHTEPYEDAHELAGSWTDASFILLHDECELLSETIQLVSEREWTPVIAYAVDPDLSRVVDAVFMGATDYLALPIENKHLARRLDEQRSQQKSIQNLRQQVSRSRRRLTALSDRERAVLLSLAEGASNKTIAHELQISPRTIEIHRANMMSKLGVNHLGEAVSIALYANLGI